MDEAAAATPQPSQPADDYQETDVFTWANNLVQYVDDLNIELFLFNKNYVMYKANTSGNVHKQLRPLFVDDILEYILGGAEKGLVVRDFEAAESEENVLQKTRVSNVDKLVEVLGWLRTQEHEIEVFKDEEHDLKRIKGVLARCSHKEMDAPFYIIKSMPTSQLLNGKTAWMLREGKFVPFEAAAALKIPAENQLLVVGQDLFVFNQGKLKALFGYDAKEASIAAQKVAEIEANFTLSFLEGANFQSLVKDKKAMIKKLQKIEPSLIKQEDLLNHAEEIGVDMMTDDSGAIIIMDSKDMEKFVNLLNEDYMESPLTGQRYEIIRKKPLKITEEAYGEVVI